MPKTWDRARVGLVVGPTDACATVIRQGEILTVALPGDRADLSDPFAVFEALKALGPEPIGSITLDISQLLHAALTQAEPMLPSMAVIRIVPQRADDNILARSPDHLVERLVVHRFTVPGGHDLLGNELHRLDRIALERVCVELADSGVHHVAIIGAGSQSRPHHEREVADAVQAAVPTARISAASDFGGTGLVRREATVVFNAALKPLADRVLGRFESAAAELIPDAALVVARGDGGHSTPARVRAVPVVALGATQALELAGAASTEGQTDCRVRLRRPGGRLTGSVRHGLPVVGPTEMTGFGIELVVPTAALVWEPDRPTRAERDWVIDVPLIELEVSTARLASIGAAQSRPTAWLDEVAFIETPAQLAEVLRNAEQRAVAITMANGAAPGTAVVIEQSAVALPYNPFGTVRVRVRAAGTLDHSRGRAVFDNPGPVFV